MKISEKRKYQLSYCKICKNKLFNVKVGIVCGITNQLATFEKSCPDYKFDKKELNELQKKTNDLIENSYPSRNFLNKVILGTYLNKNEKINNKTTKVNSKNEFGTSNSFFQILFVALTIFLIYFVGIKYEQFFKGSSEMDIYIGLFFLLLMWLLSFYFGFIEKAKPEVIFNQYFMEYNHRRFIFKKEKRKIYWDDIINLRLLTIEDDGIPIEKIIIGTISHGINEINTNHFDTEANKFMSLIKQRAKNVA